MKKITLLLFALFHIWACEDDRPSQIDLRDVPAAQRDSVKNSIKEELEAALPFRLETFQTIENSDFIFFPMELFDENIREKSARWNRQGKFGGYSSYEDPTECWNMLFYNTKTKAYHALLKDTVGVIEGYYQFTASPPDTLENEEGKVTIIPKSKHPYFGPFAANYLFYLIRYDYNQNGILDYEDPTQLYISDKKGENLTALTPPETDVVDWEFYKNAQLLIVHTRIDAQEDKKFNRKDREHRVFEINLNNPTLGIPIFSNDFIENLKDMMLEKHFFNVQ